MSFPDLPPNLPAAEYVLAYEARSVHDAAMLSPADYGAPAAPAWIIAEVKPAAGSGAATIPGAYLDAGTGAVVSPPGASGAVMKRGHWQAVGAADPSLMGNGSFSWTEPLDAAVRGVDPEQVYSAFSYGGLLLLKPRWQAAGRDQFAACRLIFAEWGRPVADALHAAAELERAAVAARQGRPADLARLATGSNPALATLAFRDLLTAQVPIAAQGSRFLAATDARSAGTFTYLSLVFAAAERPLWMPLLLAMVDGGKEPNRLLAIGYAAHAVQVFAPQDAAAQQGARQVLQRLKQRADALGVAMPAGSRWQVLFSRGGVG